MLNCNGTPKITLWTNTLAYFALKLVKKSKNILIVVYTYKEKEREREREKERERDMYCKGTACIKLLFYRLKAKARVFYI